MPSPSEIAKGPTPKEARALRRERIERIFREAHRMARMMGCRFVVDPRRLRMFVRAQATRRDILKEQDNA